VAFVAAAALVCLAVYAVAVWLLYRDCQIVLSSYADLPWLREIAQSTARLRWCARTVHTGGGIQ
jgi:hypothetical protein